MWFSDTDNGLIHPLHEEMQSGGFTRTSRYVSYLLPMGPIMPISVSHYSRSDGASPFMCVSDAEINIFNCN